jgi:hypothetical protein
VVVDVLDVDVAEVVVLEGVALIPNCAGVPFDQTEILSVSPQYSAELPGQAVRQALLTTFKLSY